MKRIILITLLIVGLLSAYGFAQMGQGHMMGQGMMGGQSQQPAGTQYESGHYPCPQMMGGGMMGGYGMGPGMMGGMMGPGMMGGYGMMGSGMMGDYGMMGRMRGMMGAGSYGMQGLDPAAYQKYLNDTRELRKKLHDKKFDYFEAARNPDIKRESLMKLEKEILDLQWELYEKAPK
jgi:hypothetical protein